MNVDPSHLGPRLAKLYLLPSHEIIKQLSTSSPQKITYNFIFLTNRDLRHVVTVLIPRVRTLGVRLSEEEYAALEKFSIQSGARSMSDVARTAICDFIRHAIHESALSSAVSEHGTQVKSLEQRVEQLTTEIALLKASKAGS